MCVYLARLVSKIRATSLGMVIGLGQGARLPAMVNKLYSATTLHVRVENDSIGWRPLAEWRVFHFYL